MNKIITIFIVLILNTICLADDQYVFEAANPKPAPTKIDKSIIVDKTFASIEEVANYLTAMGFKTIISGHNLKEPCNQNIKVSSNLQDFIALAGNKFNYNVANIKDLINFYPKNPIPAIKTPAQIAQNSTWSFSPDDKYISKTLTRWAKSAGYQLHWAYPNDYEIEVQGDIHGSLRYAINQVIKSFQNSDHPLIAKWYQNNVIEINTEGK